MCENRLPLLFSLYYTQNIQCTARRVLDENINMYSTEAYPTHEGQQLPAGQSVVLTSHRLATIEEETYRRKGKGRRCWLGDVLECGTSHLAARMI